MAMRETVGSLRAYFILVGVVSLVSSGNILRQDGSHGVIVAVASVQVAISVAFIVSGALLPRLLRDSPIIVIGVVGAAAAMRTLDLVASLALLEDKQKLTSVVVLSIIAFVIYVYLFVNINRLSKTAS